MSKTLLERLDHASLLLTEVDAALNRHPGALSAEVDLSFRNTVRYSPDIEFWKELVATRDAAREFLSELETTADGEGLVPFGKGRVKYQHARLVGVQAYQSIQWALADRIAGMVGRILCTREAGSNELSPAQLVSHFVQRDRTKKTTAAALFDSVRQTFGWPIGISYALRNHFVHDGGQIAGVQFFEGPDAASAFRISQDGWARIEDRAGDYGVDPSLHRAGPTWPTSPRDDLRVVMLVCEREMDDALGVVLGSACRTLLGHVGMMLGEDP